jgi:hypothetical protein
VREAVRKFPRDREIVPSSHARGDASGDDSARKHPAKIRHSWGEFILRSDSFGRPMIATGLKLASRVYRDRPMPTDTLPRLRLHSAGLTADQLNELFSRWWTWCRKSICGPRGHDFVVHLEGHRMSLRCAHCLRQTPGWLSNPSPSARATQDGRRPHSADSWRHR